MNASMAAKAGPPKDFVHPNGQRWERPQNHGETGDLIWPSAFRCGSRRPVPSHHAKRVFSARNPREPWLLKAKAHAHILKAVSSLSAAHCCPMEPAPAPSRPDPKALLHRFPAVRLQHRPACTPANARRYAAQYCDRARHRCEHGDGTHRPSDRTHTRPKAQTKAKARCHCSNTKRAASAPSRCSHSRWCGRPPTRARTHGRESKPSPCLKSKPSGRSGRGCSPSRNRSPTANRHRRCSPSGRWSDKARNRRRPPPSSAPKPCRRFHLPPRFHGRPRAHGNR